MGNQNSTHQHQIEIENLWSFQRREVEQASDFKSGLFSLDRVRKMMKVEEDVDRISAEVPVVLAKACDLFILLSALPSDSSITTEKMENSGGKLSAVSPSAAICQDSCDWHPISSM
nr:nuclear transcription factor Y subunit C-1-like [Arachis hypogaea]